MPKKCWTYRNGRPGVEVTFRAPDGQKVTKMLMVDTGASLEFILSKENLALLKFIDAPDADGGVWGRLKGALVYLSMSELSPEKPVVVFTNEGIFANEIFPWGISAA